MDSSIIREKNTRSVKVLLQNGEKGFIFYAGLGYFQAYLKLWLFMVFQEFISNIVMKLNCENNSVKIGKQTSDPSDFLN